MKTKVIKVSEILDFLADKLIKVYGPIDGYIDNLSDAANVNETTLDWINPSTINKQGIAERSLARVILVDDSIKYNESIQIAGKTLIVVDNPKVCLAYIGNHYFVKKIIATIHNTAIIDKNVQIGKNVCIGANSVIGKCIIGDNTVIDANVNIYDDVVIGNNCTIKAGAVLGGAGFGFEKDKNGNRFRFPQIGGLIIGDNVEIGANTCIDRGALSDTIIGNYTKINNLCHIAHNNIIGKNVIITACVNISGSNTICDNVWIAPNSSIRGWITINKDAVIGMGSVVINDIPAGETWVGCPAKKLEKK